MVKGATRKNSDRARHHDASELALVRMTDLWAARIKCRGPVAEPHCPLPSAARFGSNHESMSDALSSLFSNLEVALAREPEGLFREGQPVLIYGAGSMGEDVCRLLHDRGVAVSAFLDRRALPSQNRLGVPVLTPDAATLDPVTRAHSRVLLATFNALVDPAELDHTLRTLGYRHISTLSELHARFPDQLGDRYWLCDRHRYRGAEADCKRLWSLLSDGASRDLLLATLRYRFELGHSALPSPEFEHPYFDPSLPPTRRPLRLLDCGAFDGDTLRQVMLDGQPWDAVVAFEPDPENFARLSRFVVEHRPRLPRTLMLSPCGLHASTTQLRFSSDRGAASRVATSGDTMIQCVAIDDALPGFEPTLIKMDIKGAEPAALLGARRTIQASRPELAISVYHDPLHITQIPLRIHEWYGTSASYHLRSHGHHGFDLVFYAKPHS